MLASGTACRSLSASVTDLLALGPPRAVEAIHQSTTFRCKGVDLRIREPGRLAYGRLDTAPYLRAAVQAIAALPQAPHAVVLTGDLTDFGRADEYQHLAGLPAPLPMPLYLLPGNHDERAQLRRSFAEHAYLGDGEFVQ